MTNILNPVELIPPHLDHLVIGARPTSPPVTVRPRWPIFGLLGAAYLVGPGFAVGTGTTVSTSSVALGPLPAFPALAALPAEGTPPGWAVGFLALPPAIAAVAAARAQSRTTARAYDYAALRGAGMGLGDGVLVSLLVALAGGQVRHLGRVVDEAREVVVGELLGPEAGQAHLLEARLAAGVVEVGEVRRGLLAPARLVHDEGKGLDRLGHRPRSSHPPGAGAIQRVRRQASAMK